MTEDEKSSILVDPDKEKGRMSHPLRIPSHWVDSDTVDKGWVDVDGGTWRKKDHINLGEGRGTLRIAQVASCNPGLHRSRSLVLSDNQVVVGAFTKGRSPSRKLNRLIQRLASIQLGTGMQFLFTWIKSALNPSDPLSRDKRRRNVLQASRCW